MPDVELKWCEERGGLERTVFVLSKANLKSSEEWAGGHLGSAHVCPKHMHRGCIEWVRGRSWSPFLPEAELMRCEEWAGGRPHDERSLFCRRHILRDFRSWCEASRGALFD